MLCFMPFEEDDNEADEIEEDNNPSCDEYYMNLKYFMRKWKSS